MAHVVTMCAILVFHINMKTHVILYCITLKGGVNTCGYDYISPLGVTSPLFTCYKSVLVLFTFPDQERYMNIKL